MSLFAQQQAQITRDVTTGDINTHNTVWHGETFVYGHCVRDAITGVQHDACCPARSVSTTIHSVYVKTLTPIVNMTHQEIYKNITQHEDVETYKLKTACMEINRAGTLKLSKNISADFSRFLFGFSGASVSNTGC